MSIIIATSIDDALAALAAGARPIAGGTDLVVGARHGKSPMPEALVAIDRIDELRTIVISEDGATLGAGVSHHMIESHAELASRWSALADGSALVGSPATRHLGTIGGNVMHGSPAMDTGAPLVVLGASAELRSLRGSRSLPIAALWTGPSRLTADPDELCVAVHLPMPAPRSGSAYMRLEYRRAMEIAVAGAAAYLTLADDGSVATLRVALSAVAPTIVELTGLPIGASVADTADAAALLAAEQSSPISDLRASDRYRRHTVGVMARRAVVVAAQRADGTHIGVPASRHTGIGAAS